MPDSLPRSGSARVADEIRAREKKTAEDGLILTLLDTIEERDALAAAVRAVELPASERPIRGGLLTASCPHCGRDL